METSPPSGPSNSPSRKRCLANPDPNQTSTTASPESTLSSNSSPDRIVKKTRELPNLSDCHSCGHRINYSNPKERLQPLDSMWRIVLLCRNCSKRINSSDLCPYCFSGSAVGGDCFKCRDCDRCIHKDCVGKYGGIAPWSYTCSGLGFSVCIDCWVPDSLVSSIRVYKRKSRKKKTGKNTTVSVGGGNTKLIETVKDANRLAERKVVDAVKAKENAVKKAEVAKSIVELATGAVNLVHHKDEKGKSSGCSRDNEENKVKCDAELAIMLHRAMNSSARISRNKCLVSASSLLGLDSQVERVGSSGSGCGCRELEACGNNRNLCKNIDRTVFETSVCFKISDCSSFVDLSNGMMNRTTSSSGNECQASGEGRCDGNTDRYLLKYRRTDKTVSKSSLFSRASDFVPCQDPDNLNAGVVTDTKAYLNGNGWLGNGEKRCSEKRDRYLLKYTRACLNGNKCQRNAEGSSIEKPDRDLLKYTRTSVNGDECQENGEGKCNEKFDRYLLKYRRNYRNDIQCHVKQEGGCKEKADRYFLKYTRTCLNRNHCQGNGKGKCNEKPDRYSLKYAKRSKSSDPALSSEIKSLCALCESFDHENQNSMPFLSSNYSEESRTFLDGPLQAYSQAFACATGSS